MDMEKFTEKLLNSKALKDVPTEYIFRVAFKEILIAIPIAVTTEKAHIAETMAKALIVATTEKNHIVETTARDVAEVEMLVEIQWVDTRVPI